MQAAMESRILDNPFTPTFGQVPANMAGRDRLLREMGQALNARTRAPELTMLLSGARGSGKTVLLASIAEEAQRSGWVCASTVAAEGMLEDILVQAVDKAGHFVDIPGQSNSLTGVGIGQILSLEWERGGEQPANWRLRMQKLISALEEAGSGLVVLVDELDPSVEEAVQLASIYQLFVMENRKVALVMAGLPYNIERAKGDKRISFVRRAQQRRLGRVADIEVGEAIRKTVVGAGRSIGDEALEIAVGTAAGFPFMIQLVGYRMWARSPENDEISAEDARVGSALAQEELRSYVLESTYRDLSDGDVAFLKAMLPDAGQSLMKDVAARMGKSSSYASTYRERLLRQGVIGEPDRNAVGFELPGFREFFAERIRWEG